MITKGVFLIILGLTLSISSFGQDKGNVDDLLKVYEMTKLIVESEEEIIKNLIKDNDNQIIKNKKDEKDCYDKARSSLVIIPTNSDDYIVNIEKSKAEVKFYYKVIAPVEDIKNTKLDSVNTYALLDDFEKVIKSADSTSRDAAIKEMCSGKSMMEKVQYGSALFSMLGGVYNTDMTGGRSDPFTNEDPTKNASDDQTITIQRQYNALNESKFGGTDFVPYGGVCRHASVAVTDFLDKCGLNMEANKNVGYRTQSGGHATVKAIDPETGKTYYLNWGELIQSETIDPMSNFEVSSSSLPDSGMLIQIYDGDDEGKRTGTIRNSKGTFLARVLDVDDDDIDVSTYTYNEAGAIVDLGSKKITYASGKTIEASNFITTKYAQGSNTNAAGFQNDIISVAGKFNHERVKSLANGFVFKRNVQLSSAYFKADESLNLIMDPGSEIKTTQDGVAIGLIVGGGIGKNFKTKKTQHYIEGSTDIVTEIYAFNTTRNGNSEANKDGGSYAIVRLDSKNKITPNTELSLGVSTTLGVDNHMTANDGKYNAFTDNTKSYVMVRQSISPSNTFTGRFSTISSVEKKFYTGTLGFENAKSKFKIESGVTVMKYDHDDKSIYHIVKVSKEFDINSLNLNLAGQVMTPISNSAGYTSPYVSATVIITPKFGKRKQ